MRAALAAKPIAALAQLVEHRIRNAGVVGSNPIGGTIFFNNLRYKFGNDVGQCFIQASTGQAL
jgi:hypothetical protein